VSSFLTAHQHIIGHFSAIKLTNGRNISNIDKNHMVIRPGNFATHLKELVAWLTNADGAMLNKCLWLQWAVLAAAAVCTCECRRPQAAEQDCVEQRLLPKQRYHSRNARRQDKRYLGHEHSSLQAAGCLWWTGHIVAMNLTAWQHLQHRGNRQALSSTATKPTVFIWAQRQCYYLC